MSSCSRAAAWLKGALLALGCALGVIPTAGFAIAETTPTYESNEPAAFRSGILFHSSIPVANRGVLLADLAWLAELGTLPESAPLGRALGLGEGNLQGSRLVDWIAENVHLVHGLSWCPQSGQVIVSNLNQKYPRSLYGTSARCTVASREGTVYGHVTPYLSSGTYGTWRKASGQEADAFVVDDRLLVETRGIWGLPRIVAIGAGALFAEKGMSGRILRISTLVHEGYHIAGTGHVACQEMGWPRATEGIYVFGFRKTQRRDFERHCDSSRAGAYPVEAMLTHVLRKACRECGADPEVAYREARQWSAVEIPIKAGTSLPAGFLAAVDPKRQLVGLTHVPPREYFAALAEARELNGKAGDCPDCAGQAALVRKASTDLDGLAKRNALGDSWTGTARPLRTQNLSGDGVAWVRAAIAAKGSEHNVPLKHAPRCAELSRGCSIF